MIKALNEPEVSNSASEESSNDESGKQQTSLSKEALEEQYFDKYQKALLAIQKDRKDEAKDLLEELEDTLDGLKSPDEILMQLKFSVLRNLGNLVPNDTDHYVEALVLDSSDISLWIKLGDRCMRLKDYTFARNSYEQALTINANNWIAIERLIELYYVLHLPFELYDICSRALSLNPNHKKASMMLKEATILLPFFDQSQQTTNHKSVKRCLHDDALDSMITHETPTLGPLLALKRKRQHDIQTNLQKFKRSKLGITLDTARTQSLASFGNYIIKIYERFSKQCITRNTMIDITINNTSSFSQQFNQNQNSSSDQPQQQTLTCSQDVEITAAVSIDHNNETGASDSQNMTSENKVPATTNGDQTTNTSTDDNDQTTKSNGGGGSGGGGGGGNHRTRSNHAPQSSSQSSSQVGLTNHNKSSSLSFAAMLFPQDLNDKRRSSRNRSNQDDTFSFKMKFDELNVLLPECLRIGAIEQALQRRREEQQQEQAQKLQSQNGDQQDKSESEHAIPCAPEEGSIPLETNLDPVREDQIIKDVIEEISTGHTKKSGTTISNVKLCHMFYVYLSKLAAKKQNTLPDAFVKIYKIYRRLCPLPTSVFIDIGPDGVQLNELWFMLTANEVVYQHAECAFMLRVLEQLHDHLDDVAHREFLVRLFLVMGMNNDYKYLEMALQNIEEDVRIYASNRKIITRAHIKTLIDRKTEKLQELEQQMPSVQDSDDPMEIIEQLAPKSENEMSDREIQLLCNAVCSAKLWQRGLNIINQRNDLNSDIIIETINICLKNGAKMDAILASKLCKEAISGTRPTTWSCLYRGWLSVLPLTTAATTTGNSHELVSATDKDEKTINSMDKFFDLGHQTLGKKNTCTLDKGEFLMLHVEHLLDDERDSFEDRDLWGSTYCLFGYPTKRPVAVAAHKAIRVPILWEYAQVIYHYLEPEELPTYMSLLRKAGITSEVEVLFREIAECTPPELTPIKCVHIVENFIELGEPLIATELAQVGKSDVTRDLYYLLADYYFKNKDFKKAKLFYHYDLVINPDRFDSWAASGLIRASGIDKALADGAVKTQDLVRGYVRDLADAAIRCFEQATKLKPDEPKATLWIEFGNLTYNLMSLAARLYIYDDFTSGFRETETTGPRNINELVDEAPTVDDLIEVHRRMYKLTKNCFRSANALCPCGELWLHYYMLGKIAEKVDPLDAIEYYHKADAQLFQEGASYPRKISYHNPPDLAYEAMEVHYRIHAAALKILVSPEQRERPNQATLNSLRRSLLNAQRSPFVLLEGCNDPKIWVETNHEQHRHKEVQLLLDDTINCVVSPNATMSECEFMCLHGIKRCLVRCDKNFKALYRLAYFYRATMRPRMAQKILMSKEPFADERYDQLMMVSSPHLPDFMQTPPDLRGVDSLFKDRKQGNLFYGIWRMPIEEIDRPGCFEHWMFRCTWLLINTCGDVSDTNTLNTIAVQLNRQPETSKRYLQDRPRVILARTALERITDVQRLLNQYQ